MAKNNNKGFSLIEIVIAIAILTLLLTPIVRQLSQTMETSRKAKEQQYANENAVYELERVQRIPIEELDNEIAPDIEERTCLMVDSGGTVVDNVPYNVSIYDYGNVELGPKNSEYRKQVMLDDLSNKIRASDTNAPVYYKIGYSYTKDDLAAFPDYILTNEGSLVHYDADGFIDMVVCEVADKVDDPNDVNLGNMHDLDNRKVAMINGTASNFDAQAETKFYSMAMDRLKKLDYESWQQALLHAENDGILNQYAYSIEKLTKIYVDELQELDGTKYYLVKADVYYSNKYTIHGSKESQSFNDVISYNVFSQKFYTDKCPDIYFEYQPYTENITGKIADGTYAVTYASDDYILVDNYVEDVKLYLYKPFNDQLNKSMNIGEDKYEKNTTYTYYTTKAAYDNKSTSGIVNVHLGKADTSVKNMSIYTNLKIDDQFTCDTFSTKFVDIKSDRAGVAGTREKFLDEELIDGKTVRYLNQIADDVRKENRLYTVTVTLTPDYEGNNTVSLTGAKGEN